MTCGSGAWRTSCRPGRSTSVVSALAVHHLDRRGKQDLFARVARVLRPGGRFVLGDVVVPAGGAHGPIEIDRAMDLPDTVDDQPTWLHAAGFAAAAVPVRVDLAVFDARRRDGG
jgi:SAM-dependent methyltransferase